ncbi:hypothetical protein [Jannaschia sp. CCS1]|uniref:hypothetical protein n=1 Tax=Jannaschia sp. (strain CCS1) TaxID=290400 RepID=UPI000053DA50|nr:hypothetical protein [Jannaschia sp. CCS1]ABD55693.1 hypothetical protein Jann_2776 [Jannaschia sp. CCS1]
MLRPLTALAMLPFLASQVIAQDFLTRDEVVAHMDASVFCYYPDTRVSCAWAELYTEQNEDHAILITASATWDFPMEIAEYRIDWRGDALCIPFEDQGLRAMWQSEGYRFPFNLEGLTPLPDDDLPARRDELREDAPREFCFQYTVDPDTPGQLRQHVFRDGVWDEELDPIALIPRFSSGVAVRP